MGPHTRAIHAGERPDPRTGAVSPPLVQATTFAYPTSEEGRERFLEQGTFPSGQGFVYSRWDNPTVHALEDKLAALEGGESEQDARTSTPGMLHPAPKMALAAASGMAAISTALLSFLKSGDHVVAQRQLYSGTHQLLEKLLPRWGITVSLVDGAEPANFEAALRANTRLVYLETPSNPLLEVVDVAAVAQIARSAGALTLIDNTFATPVNQRPLELGADVVLHSMTKYLCGHGDALGGAIVGAQDLLSRCVPFLRDLGGSLSPFNAWLILRGIHTLPLRLARHNANAQALAEFLQSHPRVERVHYPGLAAHPGHQVARRQMPGGCGGMLSFEVRGGMEAGRAVVDALQLCTQAVSLGDTRTLVCHPASTTHTIVPAEARSAAGIGDGLIRVSVGLEDVEDLCEDFARALEGA